MLTYGAFLRATLPTTQKQAGVWGDAFFDPETEEVRMATPEEYEGMRQDYNKWLNPWPKTLEHGAVGGILGAGGGIGLGALASRLQGLPEDSAANSKNVLGGLGIGALVGALLGAVPTYLRENRHRKNVVSQPYEAYQKAYQEDLADDLLSAELGNMSEEDMDQMNEKQSANALT